MNPARAIADAVLYEGFCLYPYRASALKNRQRWAFGDLCPQAWSVEHGGAEPYALQCELLVVADDDAVVGVTARFLQFVLRSDDLYEGREAVARECGFTATLAQLGERQQRRSFSYPSRRMSGPIARRRPAIVGEVALSAVRVGDRLSRLRVRIENLTIPNESAGRDAHPQALGAAHALLTIERGRFISSIDPPEAQRAALGDCRNHGAWPVLIGDPQRDDQALCSPIILDDHPAIAPESPGDLFDAAEIDEILSLRIRTLTADERREAAVDPRVQRMLERAERLSPEQFARLHGAVRQPAPGRAFGTGSRVRLRPAAGNDILDLALAGRAATVVAVVDDLDGRRSCVVVLDDDPGRDLGLAGAVAHRFFFRPDDLEPLADRP